MQVLLPVLPLVLLWLLPIAGGVPQLDASADCHPTGEQAKHNGVNVRDVSHIVSLALTGRQRILPQTKKPSKTGGQ